MKKSTTILTVALLFFQSIALAAPATSLDKENLSRENLIAMLEESRQSAEFEENKEMFDRAIGKIEVASEEELEEIRVAVLHYHEVAIAPLFIGAMAFGAAGLLLLAVLSLL